MWKTGYTVTGVQETFASDVQGEAILQKIAEKLQTDNYTAVGEPVDGGVQTRKKKNRSEILSGNISCHCDSRAHLLFFESNTLTSFTFFYPSRPPVQ